MKRQDGVGLPSQVSRGGIPGVNVVPKIQPGETPKKCWTPKRVRRVDIDLATARDNEPLDISGTVLWASDASSLTANADITLDNSENDSIPFLAGTMVQGIPFKQIFITNTAQSNETLTLNVFTDCPGDAIEVDN